MSDLRTTQEAFKSQGGVGQGIKGLNGESVKREVMCVGCVCCEYTHETFQGKK